MQGYFLQPFRHARKLNILEVGLRDGLQNESKILSLDQKYTYFQFMFYAGMKNIEIGSFVSSKWVPQMKDTKELIQKVQPYRSSKPLFLSTLVPNLKGCQDAVEAKVDEICLFVSTTDTFNQKNINCTQDEAFARFRPVVKLAKENQIKVRGSLSCCFVCPYEGLVDVNKVVDTALKYKELGVDVIDVADTIGGATPEQVGLVFQALLRKVGPPSLFAGHFHDTNNNALQNIEAAMNLGISTFHSSLGGTGGCPYSSKRVGNLNTIKLLEWCQDKQIETNINLNVLKQGQKYILSQLA
jgi:hydroxymethylglutaryl-CoA lyase